VTFKEIIDDHSLSARLYLRQAGGDEYWGFCPWCGQAAALSLNPRTNVGTCTNQKCSLHGYRFTPEQLDGMLRRAHPKMEH
jgi:hypothetical protein